MAPNRCQPAARALLALLAALALAALPGGPARGAQPAQEVVFGALLSLSGDWSSLGTTSKAALELAVEEINTRQAAAGSPARARLIVEDTRLDPATALVKLRSLAAQGVRMVVGPQSSSEVRALKPFADQNGIILISQGSTASSLAIAGDNVFRFVPDDTREIEAMVALLQADGIKTVIPIWRDDVGNEGLALSLKRLFAEAGGTVLDGLKYGTSVQDFSAEVTALGGLARQTVERSRAGPVAIYLAAFDEVVPLFDAARDDALLASLRWYGSDGVVHSKAVTGSASAARFATTAGYPNPYLGMDEDAKARAQPLVERITAATGTEPDAFAFAAYDAAQVAFQAALAAGGTGDAAALRDALVRTAETYSGLTGSTALNEAGDRRLVSFDFWSVRERDGAPQWVRVARYQARPDGGGTIVR